ncbi:hypothetical protein ACR79S_03045 [Sphingobacterium spiritivorum]
MNTNELKVTRDLNKLVSNGTIWLRKACNTLRILKIYTPIALS